MNFQERDLTCSFSKLTWLKVPFILKEPLMAKSSSFVVENVCVQIPALPFITCNFKWMINFSTIKWGNNTYISGDWFKDKLYTQSFKQFGKLSIRLQSVFLKAEVGESCSVFPLPHLSLLCFCLFLSVFMPGFNISIWF